MHSVIRLAAVLLLAAGCQCDEAAPKQASGAVRADTPASDPDAIGPLQQAKVKSTQLQIDQVIQALATYKVQNGAFPSPSQGLAVLVEGGFLPRPPKDGWGRALVYSLDKPDEPRVTSLGADGKPGGRGPDADISAEE